jgi:hypothetical protein
MARIIGNIGKEVNRLKSQALQRKVSRLRRETDDLKAQYDAKKAELQRAENKIMEVINNGYAFPWCWIVEKRTRKPAWKTHFINVAGKAEADRLLNSTKYSYTQVLEVEGFDARPQKFEQDNNPEPQGKIDNRAMLL